MARVVRRVIWAGIASSAIVGLGLLLQPILAAGEPESPLLDEAHWLWLDAGEPSWPDEHPDESRVVEKPDTVYWDTVVFQLCPDPGRAARYTAGKADVCLFNDSDVVRTDREVVFGFNHAGNGGVLVLSAKGDAPRQFGVSPGDANPTWPFEALIPSGPNPALDFLVEHKETIETLTEGTDVPAIMVAAGVMRQAPGDWDDFASTFFKCNFLDCNPSVGIAQITPGEVERFVDTTSERREIIDELRNDDQFSVEMMHAKLVDARTRFDKVAQRLGVMPSATDYFVMYAIAQNGLCDPVMELALTQGWEAVLKMDDESAAWNVWLMHGGGYARWHVREVAWHTRELVFLGYDLPDDVDLDLVAQLGSVP